MKELSKIFQNNGCDKLKHGYFAEYEKEFKPIRGQEINILEVGIWKGTSHQSWLEYFPNAQVFGIDIFSRVKPQDVPVLKNKRMHYISADSTGQDVVGEIESVWPDIEFNYIIDDGLHTPKANEQTLCNLWPFLKEDGVYYIEDMWPIHSMSEKEMEHPWIKKHPNRYNTKDQEYLKSLISILNTSSVEEIDFRSFSGMGDSYIVKIIKDIL